MRLRPIALPPLILIVLWVGAVWWPLRSGTTSEQERLADAQAEQLSLVSRIDGLNAVTEQLVAFDADLDRFAAAIPPTLGMPALIRQLDAEADVAGIQIDLLSPNEVLGGATRDSKRPVPVGMYSVTLSMTAQGSFESAMEFVDRLEALQRLIVIDLFELSAVDGDAEQIIIDLELRVFTTEALVAPATGFAFSTDTEAEESAGTDGLVQPWVGQAEPSGAATPEESS